MMRFADQLCAKESSSVFSISTQMPPTAKTTPSVQTLAGSTMMGKAERGECVAGGQHFAFWKSVGEPAGKSRAMSMGELRLD